MAGIPWTDDDIFYLRKCALVGMTQEETAQVLGRTTSSINVKASKEKIPFKRRKLLTQEEYVQKLEGKNIIVLDTYITAKKPIRHKCVKCEHIWKARPSSILNLCTGCPMCNTGYNLSTQSILYLLEIRTCNELFLKVGLTCDTNKRVTQLKSRTNGNITILDTIAGLGGYIHEQEQKIHSDKEILKYSPQIKFSGHTECYDISSKDKLLSIFNSLK